jgi:thermitase
VKFKPGVSQADQHAVHVRKGGIVMGEMNPIAVTVVSVPPGREAAAAEDYRNDQSVVYAEPDQIASAAATANDTYYAGGYQWNLSKIQAPAAWDYTKGSAAIKVAVLDSGINRDHPDLAGKVLTNVNFSLSPLPDVAGHGTAVAGIIAATTNNGVGVASLGYNTMLLNVKVIDDDSTALYSAIIDGILWAADNGAQVINLSVGGTGPSVAMEDAVNYAWSKGIVVAAAAGNSGNSDPIYPAYYSKAIAVAATDITDSLIGYSNRGTWVDIAAPGGSIWSTTAWNGYAYQGGTSMAAPHVAALAALEFTRVTDSNGDGRLNDEVRSCIQNNADNIGVAGIGSGRINAYKTVLCGSAAPTTGILSGTVTDSISGAGIAGATVNAGASAVTTSSSGSYQISGLVAGVYSVNVSAPGYSAGSNTVTVSAGAAGTQNFSLVKTVTTGAIAGTVTDSSTGLPIPGAVVTAGAASTTSNAAGSYTLSGLSAGSYTVSSTAAGYISGTRSGAVVAGSTTTVNLALAKAPSTGMWVQSITFATSGKTGLKVTVTIVNANGQNVAGANVSLQLLNAGKTTNFQGSTGSTGTVSFGVSKAGAGTNTATVTGVTAGGYAWDPTKGQTSASFGK